VALNKTTKLWLLFIAAFAWLVFSYASCTEVVYAQETVVISVTDFGKGMTPVLPVWRNDPSALIMSQNMYSTQPGGRQLRFGYTLMTDATAADANSGIAAMALFAPVEDSGSIVYAAGGKWYGNIAGFPEWTGLGVPRFDWNAAFSAVVQIRPYNPGTMDLDADSVVGTSTRFVRDLQVGDSITASGETERVSHIISDTKLFTVGSWGATESDSPYTVTRSHDSVATPFMHQSGNYLYTGSVASPPQIIYAKDDTLRIRPMGIVDSLYIDTIYSKYPTTSAAWDSLSIYGRRSWDSALVDPGAEFIKEIQLVSRRKAGQWVYDQWLQSLSSSPEAYYVRVGFEDRTSFYTITGNSDTALYLMTWYVEAASIDTDNGMTDWTDSLFLGRGPELDDTVDVATAVGTWAYIYASAGFSQTVVPDDSTGTVTLLGRGAIFYTVDASFPIDTTEFRKGLHFIHLTGSDINFPEFVTNSVRLLHEDFLYADPGEPITQADLPPGDTIRSQRTVYVCGDNPWKFNAVFFSYEAAAVECNVRDITTMIQYRYTRTSTSQSTTESEAVGNSYFPIRYAVPSDSGDTIFFIMGTAPALTEITTASTTNWEIVRVGLPNWSGMTEWGTPAQLVAWGDSSSSSLLSFSGNNDPWNWSVNSDVIVGNNPAAPIVSAYGYDDQLVIFKPSSMLGYNGARFTELSQTDGLAAPRAVVGLTKELYWLDVDGVKKMARRDFSGYSIQKVSQALDPVFNSWSATNFGGDVVPITLVPAYRKNAVMAYNQRDRHLHLFGTFSGATNNGDLTFGVENQLWDGYFTIPATDAMWVTIRDTSRLLIGSPDSSTIFGLDYVFKDVSTGIDSDLKSAKFQIEDKGWPVKSKLKRVWFNGRGCSGCFDVARLFIIGENATDTFNLTFNNNISDIGQTFYSSQDNLSKYWQWQIKTEGNDSASVFQPHELRMEFIPVAREH